MPPRNRGRDTITCTTTSPELPALVETNLPITEAFHHRPFDGRPRRTNLRIAGTGTLPFRLRLRANLSPDGLWLGQGCFRLISAPTVRIGWLYDAVRLIEEGAQIPLLIDQGTADEFLAQQLHSASLERICAARDFPLTAVARRLRSQLSLHRHLHRRASRLSRQDVARCLVSLHASFGIFRETGFTETCKVCCGRIERPPPAAEPFTVADRRTDYRHRRHQLFSARTQGAALGDPEGAELSCTVKSVYDGDTLTASCPEGEVKVRMFGIDTPEMGQKPWGTSRETRCASYCPVTTSRCGCGIRTATAGRSPKCLSGKPMWVWRWSGGGQAAVYEQ